MTVSSSKALRVLVFRQTHSDLSLPFYLYTVSVQYMCLCVCACVLSVCVLACACVVYICACVYLCVLLMWWGGGVSVRMSCVA